MKITILDIDSSEEEEIIVRCHELTTEIHDLLSQLKMKTEDKLILYQDNTVHLIAPKDIYYFESVDQKVFAYGEQKVYETKLKLYELEEKLPRYIFTRTSKSTILNLDKIKSFIPVIGSRLEANLLNGERIMISRQYVPVLKEKIGGDW